MIVTRKCFEASLYLGLLYSASIHDSQILYLLKISSRSLNTEYIKITQYMRSDIHLTGATHCMERVFATHNINPHYRKSGSQNMTAKGKRNTIERILTSSYKTTTLHC